MARDSVQFTGDGSYKLCPWRDFDAAEFFNRRHMGKVEKKRTRIVHPRGIGKKLEVSPVFGHLFVHPVEITDDRFGADDIFAVHFDHDPEDAVRAWVLGAQV